MTLRSAALGALGLCAWLAGAPAARAHAPPQVFDVLWIDDARMLLVTNRGLIFATPSESDYRLLCNEALHVSVADVPSVTVLPDGRVLAATYEGLVASADEGCTWGGVGELGAVQTTSLAAEQAGAGRIFASSFAPGAGGVWRSDDHGASFARVLATGDDDFVRSIKVSRPQGDGHVVVYAAGTVIDQDAGFVHYVARSEDSGDTWQRFSVPVSSVELDVTLLAVSPADPSLVLAKPSTTDPITHLERLLISRDGGQTFGDLDGAEGVIHAELSQDGVTLWAAGHGGLFRTIDLEHVTRIGAAQEMTYVSEHDGRIFAAGRYAGFGNSANGLATVRADDRSLRSVIELRSVDRGVTCEPGTATAVLCEAAWRDWQAEILNSDRASASDAAVPLDADAGNRDAGAQPDTEPHAKPNDREDEGCSIAACVTKSRAMLARLGLLWSIAWLLAWRRYAKHQTR